MRPSSVLYVNKWFLILILSSSWCFKIYLLSNLSLQVISRIYKATKNYHAWKAKNRPDFKPWLNPEQMMTFLPRFNQVDIVSNEKLGASSESLEEDMSEADFKDDDY